MRIKDKSVRIDCLSPFIKERLPALDALVKKFTSDELVITSGCEKTAKHMHGSKHYTGEAIDIRTWGIYALRSEDVRKFIEELKEIFPDDLYDIVEEKDHIHIEFDPHIKFEEVKLRFKQLNIESFIESVDGVIEIPVPDFDFKLPLYYKIRTSEELKDAIRVGKFVVNAFGKYYTGITIFHPDCKGEGSVKKFFAALTKLIEVLIERVKK